MNKILVISTSINSTGGISSYIRSISSTDLSTKWNIVYISTHSDKPKLIKVYIFFYGFIKFLLNFYNAQIIHIHLSWHISLIRKLPFFLIATIFKKKTILHLHSGAEPIINSKYRKLYQFFFTYANITILLSNSIKEKLLEHFTISSSVVVYNPCPSRKNGNEFQKKNQILFVGSICENKGVYDLINSFSEVSKCFPYWQLLIAGKGNTTKINSLINKLDLSSKTKLIGWVSSPGLEVIYSESKIFCLPSYTEGFPMSILEAWNYSLPVITTQVGGLVDVLKHEKNALITKPGNINELTFNIIRLINDDCLYNKIRFEALKLCEDTFSLEKIANEIDYIYISLLRI